MTQSVPFGVTKSSTAMTGSIPLDDQYVYSQASMLAHAAC